MTWNNDSKEEGFDPKSFSSKFHVPVLLHDVLKELITDARGVYVDCTLGGGGHTAAFLKVLDDSARVIAIDQDQSAIDFASRRLVDDIEAERLLFIKSNFRDLGILLPDLAPEGVDGILMDLGVSSHQIDEETRGFSYRGNGPLDMRMNSESDFSADTLINEWSRQDIADVLREFGEEKRAWKIAGAIVEARPVRDTEHLAEIVKSQARPDQQVKTLSRVFQGLRIAVNSELDVLKEALEGAAKVLKPNGRLAVISYHSLEDRLAKRYIQSGNFEGKIEKDLYGNVLAPLKAIGKLIRPSDEEIEFNSRARSARMRIAERTSF